MWRSSLQSLHWPWQLSVVARLHPGPLCSVLSSRFPFFAFLRDYTTCGPAAAIQAKPQIAPPRSAWERLEPVYPSPLAPKASAARLVEALQSLWKPGVWQLDILLARQLFTSLWQRISPHDLHDPGKDHDADEDEEIDDDVRGCFCWCWWLWSRWWDWWFWWLWSMLLMMMMTATTTTVRKLSAMT